MHVVNVKTVQSSRQNRQRERERERQKEHTKRRITQMCFADVRYDTIRDAILTCARKPT